MKDIRPGVLEVFEGPMFSKKSKSLIDRVGNIVYRKETYNQGIYSYEFQFFKPTADTRDVGVIKSKGSSIEIPAIMIDKKQPELVLKVLYENESEHGIKYPLIGFDETQFFLPGIEDVIETLLREKRNVIVAGLGLDFRGEPFGQMGKIVLMADEVTKLTSVCQYPGGCQNEATRTQRLVDGKPAKYTDDVESIEGAKKTETYQARCLDHHFVPGKPSK